MDLSKTLMYDFHYEYAKKKWDRLKVLYTDTDSLFYEIETDDFFADIAGDVEKWSSIYGGSKMRIFRSSDSRPPFQSACYLRI